MSLCKAIQRGHLVCLLCDTIFFADVCRPRRGRKLNTISLHTQTLRLLFVFLLSPHMAWEQKGQLASLTCSGRDDRHRACYGNKVKRYIWLFGELTFHTSALLPSTAQERREAKTMFKMISADGILFFTEQNISTLQFSWESLPAITNHHRCELVFSSFFWVHLV